MKKIAFIVATLAFTMAGSLKAQKVIDNFEKPGVWSWWGSSAIKVAQDGESLKVSITNAGDKSIDNGYSTFGRDHSMQTIDFSETPVVKLQIKCEKDIKIRMNVKDIDDYVNNQDNIVLEVKGGDEYQDLYFDFTGKWKQNYPNTADVDNEEIKEFLIFANPGGAPWTGTCWIGELAVLEEKP